MADNIPESQQQLNPTELFLESIGKENKERVLAFSEAFASSIEERNSLGFVIPQEFQSGIPGQKDRILIRVGIKPFESTVLKSSAGKAQWNFDGWKPVIEESIEKINQNNEYDVEVVPPVREGNEDLQKSDGLIRLIPKGGGEQIELLCYQGTPIDPNNVPIYTNVGLQKAS